MIITSDIEVSVVVVSVGSGSLVTADESSSSVVSVFGTSLTGGDEYTTFGFSITVWGLSSGGRCP